MPCLTRDRAFLSLFISTSHAKCHDTSLPNPGFIANRTFLIYVT